MKELAEGLSVIGQNSDKLGAVGTLLVCFIGFIYALSKEHLVTGPQYRALKASEAEYKKAAKESLAELDRVKEALIRLQAEKEYAWQPKPTRRARS